MRSILRKKGIIYPLIFLLLVFFTGLSNPLNAQIEKKYAVVIGSGANIRSAPSTKGEIVYVAKSGEKMEMLEDLGTWIKVKTQTGVEGYVWVKLVRIEVEKIVIHEKTPAPSQPSQPQVAKPAAPASGVYTTEAKKHSNTAIYLIGGVIVAGAAAYLLLRKGGLLNKGTAILKITSDPSEAKVYVDGTEKCTTPCTVENEKPGNHTIKVERELYGMWEQEMELKGHQEYTIDATLAPFKYEFDYCFGSYGSGTGQFRFPWDLTIDRDGNIYVADHNNNRLQKFDSSGSYLNTLTVNSISGVKYSSSNNNLYVVGSSFPSLASISSVGLSPIFVKNIGLNEPRSLGADASGNVYVADGGHGKIVKTDANGNVLTSWTVENPVSWPQDAEVGSNGNVYVSTWTLHKIIIYSQNGTKKGEFPDSISRPRGIALDPSGNVYIISSGKSKIYKSISDGSHMITIGKGEGTGNGYLKWPRGIAVRNNGDILVADTNNHRICLWTMSEETTTTGTVTITSKRIQGSSISGNGTGRRLPSMMGVERLHHRPKRIKK